MIRKIPLSSTFTVFSIVMFIFSVFLTVFGRLPMNYGFLFVFMSTIFIIASLASAMPSKDELY